MPVSQRQWDQALAERDSARTSNRKLRQDLNEQRELKIAALHERREAKEQRDKAIARAEEAEAWIKACEEYLDKMQTSLCSDDEVTPIGIQAWFDRFVWFDSTTPKPATKTDESAPLPQNYQEKRKP